MIDKDDPLKDGLTPPGYDEYGDGPNPDNTPEKVRESEEEKDEHQEQPGEGPLG